MSYANNKDADQPEHSDTLIRACVVRCLDSIIHVLAKSKISQLWLVAVAKQASLNDTWSQISNDRFSRDVAHVYSHPGENRFW